LHDGEHCADQLLRARRGRLLGQPHLVVETGIFQLGEAVDRRHGAEEFLLSAQADPTGQFLSCITAAVLQQRPQRGDHDHRGRQSNGISAIASMVAETVDQCGGEVGRGHRH